MASQVLVEIRLALGFTLTLFAVGLVLERAWKKPWKKTYESLVIGWMVVFLLSVFLHGTVVGAISGGEPGAALGAFALLILALYPPIGLSFFVAGLLACGVVNHLSRRGAPREKEAAGPLFPPRYLWIPVLTTTLVAAAWLSHLT